MKIMLIFILSTTVFSFKSYAIDIDAQMKQAIDSFRSTTRYKVKGISRTPTLGLFVVQTNVGPLIINYDGKLLLTKNKAFHAEVKGEINGNELEKIRLEALSEIDHEQIIVVQHGSGDEQIVLYSALDCPYCLRQEQNLAKASIDATLLIIPSVLQTENWSVLTKVMCSDDRASAWSEYMLNKVIPDNNGQCYWSDNNSYTGIDQYRTIVLRTSGTPQMIYGDGVVRTPTTNNPLGVRPVHIDEQVDFFNHTSIETSYFSTDVYQPKKKKMFGLF
jgi:thiol:disulfide interchange protein DsbC